MGKLSYEKRLRSLNLSIHKTSRMRGHFTDFFKIIKAMDDLLLDYIFHVLNEEKNRVMVHQHMVDSEG